MGNILTFIHREICVFSKQLVRVWHTSAPPQRAPTSEETNQSAFACNSSHRQAAHLLLKQPCQPDCPPQSIPIYCYSLVAALSNLEHTILSAPLKQYEQSDVSKP